MTLRHLLSHTSGIPDYTDAPGWIETLSLDRSPRELLETVISAAPLFAPGERWRYSNSNYYLLGLVVVQHWGEELKRLVPIK